MEVDNRHINYRTAKSSLENLKKAVNWGLELEIRKGGFKWDMHPSIAVIRLNDDCRKEEFGL